ncbi:family 20 glycosylhydrolase [Streptomyces cavernicola]|uniref:Family 20 glycosylhydrolase n=1 Tax=Streptomyces cavernicola TaxID=3043613 RepID=A0ABT6SE96_9ACTN|nr:family 20 glycosylhydrolase [Streptomyces sp. B-S-A6]MDI3406480.1 family 20 glycosylhydrolase [Streptomyces sp. B-S-A6]
MRRTHGIRTAALLLLGVLPLALGTAAAAAPSAPAPAAAAPAAPTEAGNPATVPALSGWKPAEGSFSLTQSSRVLVRDDALADDAATFVADLADELGRTLPVRTTTVAPKEGDIVLDVDPDRAELGREGYELGVGSAISVTGRTGDGAFLGTRTALQLLRSGNAVPAGEAVDVPKYAERGVGVCACYIHVSMPWLERLIKDASYLKLNQLWLELKVKSAAHPEANEWGYYTPQQIERLQKLADQYHVQLVPEVNSPGHIDPWIRNRPDLQLTDADGVKHPSGLDITKPEAFDFVTSIIDEYFQVFDSPYWHMGADEYLLGGLEYADFPQMEAYAKEKFGPDAVPEDAFNDFINRVNAYVKAKGKRLRIWNDGISPKATVSLDRDILVEHWLNDEVKPSQLIADGHQVMNAANSLYHVRGTYPINTARLYDEGWTPQSFEGEKVASADGIPGAKITMWPDNASGNTENEVEDEVRMPLRFIAQATWGDSTPDATYAAFEERAEAVGRAPGFDNVDRTPIRPGEYRLSAGKDFLTGDSSADGARVVLGSEGTPLKFTPTQDGYYTVEDPQTGRCLETRRGERQLNTPLEPLSAITLQDCAASNRLQRWEVAVSGSDVTLANAVTRMVAVLDGNGLVQQVPDGHRAQVFGLVEP